MARPKEFDVEKAVEAVIPVFREHGFKGASAQMLVQAMGIGRQSLYDTFGDKWGVYCAALQHYYQHEVGAHLQTLNSGERAIDGIQALLDRVAADADQACLDLGSTVEFGCTHPDLVELREAAIERMSKRIKQVLQTAREQGDVSPDLDLDDLTAYVLAIVSTLRFASRSGLSKQSAANMVDIALRALR